MVLTVLLVVSALAAAPSDLAQAQLDRGRAAIAELEYGVAAEEFMAVATDPNATDAQRLEANLQAGVVQRILGNNVESRMHFLYVFKRAPDAALPGEQPPKVQGFFELVREEAAALNRAPVVIPAKAEPAPPVVTPATDVPVIATPAVEPAVQDDEGDDLRPLLLTGGAIVVGTTALATLGSLALAGLWEAAWVNRNETTENRLFFKNASAVAWFAGATWALVTAAGGAALAFGFSE